MNNFIANKLSYMQVGDVSSFLWGFELLTSRSRVYMSITAELFLFPQVVDASSLNKRGKFKIKFQGVNFIYLFIFGGLLTGISHHTQLFYQQGTKREFQ